MLANAISLSEIKREEINSSLRKANVVAWSLTDVRHADVPVSHSVELPVDKPIYFSARRMYPNHNDFIRKEIHLLLEAGITTPFSSVWSFPFVIASKEDGSPRFCVD